MIIISITFLIFKLFMTIRFFRIWFQVWIHSFKLPFCSWNALRSKFKLLIIHHFCIFFIIFFIHILNTNIFTWRVILFLPISLFIFIFRNLQIFIEQLLFIIILILRRYWCCFYIIYFSTIVIIYIMNWTNYLFIFRNPSLNTLIGLYIHIIFIHILRLSNGIYIVIFIEIFKRGSLRNFKSCLSGWRFMIIWTMVYLIIINIFIFLILKLLNIVIINILFIIIILFLLYLLILGIFL
jgi:hypothetical protein